MVYHPGGAGGLPCNCSLLKFIENGIALLPSF